MRRNALLMMLLVLLCSWTTGCADTLSGDGFRIEYTTPEGWLSSAQYSMAELEEKLEIPEGTLKLRSELPGTTRLYYPINGAYSLDASIQITASPMESYHQNYSSFNETQLGNVAQSFMRDGKIDSYQIVKAEGGCTFLKLVYTANLNPVYGWLYTTNENGAILRISVPSTAAAEQGLALDQWLNSVIISERQNVLLDLVKKYWYYAVIFVAPVGCILLKNHKAKAQN